jgi:hypothetical protein
VLLLHRLSLDNLVNDSGRILATLQRLDLLRKAGILSSETGELIISALELLQGSSTIRKELVKQYGSPFAVETAHVKFKGSDVSARIIRSLFDTARQYRESIDVYGDKASIEWPLIEHEPLVLHTAKRPEPKIPSLVHAPDYAKRLPKPIRDFTTKGVYDLAKKTHLSFTQGSGHGGSHPHLAHEFAMSLAEDREPFPNARQSANWTCVGLCAHESALTGVKIIKLPAFTQ